MTVTGYGTTSLDKLQKIAGVKPGGTRKDLRIAALMAYYAQDDVVKHIWDSLSAYEKDLLTCTVQSDYHPTDEDMRGIQIKHGVKSENRYGYGNRFFPENSKLYLLLSYGDVPAFIKEALAAIVPPLEILFKPSTVPDNYEEVYFTIQNREDCYAHFDMLVRFVNQEKVTATKAGGLMNKKSLLKFQARTRHEDVFYGDAEKIDEIRNIGETVVSYAMVKLLLNAKVLAVHSEQYVLGGTASYFIGLDEVGKASFLYEAYVKHDNMVIDECQRIAAHRYQFARSWYDLSDPIKTIAKFLSHCPVMEWVSIKSLKTMIRKMNHDFLRDSVGDLRMRDDYYNAYYETPNWNEFEAHFIDVAVMEYFGVLGLVDVLIEQGSDDYGTRSFPETVFFRLTELGAFLLGVRETYTPKARSSAPDATGFMVQPNFDIIVPEGSQRLTHEIYFERFLSKTVSDEQVSVFKLDFAGMAAALDMGIGLDEILAYLQTCAVTPVPENVVTTFNDWIARSKRITVRTVTLLETDDAFLLEELKSYRNVKNLLGPEVKHAVTINAKDIKKVKAAIEKNRRFVAVSLS